MRTGLVFIVVVVMIATKIGATLFTSLKEDPESLRNLGRAIDEVLDTLDEAKCFPLLLTDGETSANTIYQEMDYLRAQWGVGMFDVVADFDEINKTQEQLSRVVGQARRLRKSSWCVTVVVISDNIEFLDAFAETSLNRRLLVWLTRLLIVTRLPREDIGALLTSHWTFSMTNAMVLNAQIYTQELRCGVFVHLPYTPDGSQVIQLASWTSDKGLLYLTPSKLFPEKYQDFHDMTINVTALPYEPYWMTSVEDNVTRHYGIDYNQLETLAQAVNFKFRVLHSNNWAEVTDQVMARTSFMASIVYVVLPSRLERWDYTHTFDYSPFCFALAKPVLKPSWLSCYYPLSNEVWSGVLVSTIVVCFTLVKITGSEFWRSRHGEMSASSVVLETIGNLLGQGLYGRISTSKSNHILVGTWLLFGVVLSTGYRGSLIASLTLPTIPPRPETVEELVTAIERATIEPYGISYKGFFTVSDNSVFRSLGKLMHVGVHITQGLDDALTMRRAHVGGQQYLELSVAQHFTRIDGTSPIYIGREIIIESASAWPIPHDAPYKPVFDQNVMAITEAGLYEQWRKEMLDDASRQSRVRQRQELKKQESEGNTKAVESNTNTVKSLTVTHIQGPLLILLIGIVLSSVTFLIEKLTLYRSSGLKEI